MESTSEELARVREELALAQQQIVTLQASERRYRELVEGLPEPVLVHIDDVIAYANSACVSELGFTSVDQLIGHSILEFATPASRAQIVARMTAAREVGVVLDVIEQSFIRPCDRREVHAEIRSIPFVFDGRPGMLSIARDVGRRQAAERIMAQAQLEAELAHRKLATILAALPVGVWIADAAGQVVETNPAAARIWGGRAPLAELAESDVYKAFWPRTGVQLEAAEWALARTLATGSTVIAEAVDIERFDGTRGHVLNSTAPILDADGHLIGGVAVILDVTEAHAAERERARLFTLLEFERRRLGTLLEKAPSFIAVVRGKQHVFELANEAYYALVGPRDLIGKPVLVAIPEIAGQGFIELLDGVLETGTSATANGVPVMVSRRPNAPKEQRYVDFVFQALVEADGTRSGVFVHGVDVTESLRTQRRVHAQFHGVPVPTYVWQRVGVGAREFVLIDFNHAAEVIPRSRIGDHLGEPATVFFATSPGVVDELVRCLDHGETIQQEMDRIFSTTGETRRLLVTYAASPPDLVIVHTEDVTERRKLEGQLRQGQKMEAVGRLAGGIAHDFNNILSVILSYTAIHLEELRAEDPLFADLTEIHKAGLRAVALTRQLLAFSRKQVLEPSLLDLDQVLGGLETMLRRLLGEDVELTLLGNATLGGVVADRGQLEQVVMNLAINARDAMPAGGRLTIETSDVDLSAKLVADLYDATPGAYVLLAVTDTGCGMDDATRAQIFEPFFTTKGHHGTGLGLSTVFGIVHQSGGAIGVTSELGTGTTFNIYLPRGLRRARGVTSPPPLDSRRPRGTETILLVEDDEAVRTLVRTLLRLDGYTVLEAANGGEALLICEQFPSNIDLLLTDVVMPRMSGRQVAERLIGGREGMKVLYMSGYTDDAVVRHGVLTSSVAFLQKPITHENLRRKVRAVLDARREREVTLS